MLNYTDEAVSLTIRMSLEKELVIDYLCARITSFQKELLRSFANDVFLFVTTQCLWIVNATSVESNGASFVKKEASEAEL